MYRRDKRIDCEFGFAEYDRDLATNYSSHESSCCYSTTEGNEDHYDKAQQDTARLTCSICLNNFVRGDTIYEFGCHQKHVFHKDCAALWIEQALNNSRAARMRLLRMNYVRGFDQSMSAEVL